MRNIKLERFAARIQTPEDSDRKADGWRGAIDVDRMVLCVHCGYALRGLRSDQHCPECGTTVGTSLWSQPAVLIEDAAPLLHVQRALAVLLGTPVCVGVVFALWALIDLRPVAFWTVAGVCAYVFLGGATYLSHWTQRLGVEELTENAKMVYAVAVWAMVPLVTTLLLPAVVMMTLWHVQQLASLLHDQRVADRFSTACWALVVAVVSWPVAFIGAVAATAWLLAVFVALLFVAAQWVCVMHSVSFALRTSRMTAEADAVYNALQLQ